MEGRWATFDCYGTLVDWMRGIGDELASIWPGAERATLLRRYHQVEPSVQAGRGIPYRQVMAEATAAVAIAEGLELSIGDRDRLASSLPAWPIFPEVPGALAELRRRGWRLAILSNTDADLLDASVRAIGVPIDLRIVASEIGSYKPAHEHWEAFARRSGADPSHHVHVAASPFHDLAPAAELGIRCVWINREAASSPLPRAAELPDLAHLPDALDALLPAEPATR